MKRVKSEFSQVRRVTSVQTLSCLEFRRELIASSENVSYSQLRRVATVNASRFLM